MVNWLASWRKASIRTQMRREVSRHHTCSVSGHNFQASHHEKAHMVTCLIARFSFPRGITGDDSAAVLLCCAEPVHGTQDSPFFVELSCPAGTILTEMMTKSSRVLYHTCNSTHATACFGVVVQRCLYCWNRAHDLTRVCLCVQDLYVSSRESVCVHRTCMSSHQRLSVCAGSCT